MLDRNGYILYYAKKGAKFNLPKGMYEAGFSFDKLPPIDYSISRLPEREKNGNIEIKKLEFRPGVPGFAEINARKGTITMDHYFLELPTFIKDFVFLHECGHFYYRTEWKCDMFSTSGMLNIGWNPSQIRTASSIIKNKSRKRKIANHLEPFEI